MSNADTSANYFDLYRSYTADTEVPRFFHRWAAVVGLGAWLGRNFLLPFGHSTIAPNLYVMMLGAPGTRKSTAIKIQKKLLLKAGYSTLAADKTTKEKFLLDLAEPPVEADVLFESLDDATPRECFIAPDEFGDFFGSTAVLEFLSTLGVLWDFPDEFYESRVKNSQSLRIYAPTISMLTGNTPTTFATMFPPEVIGQGFFSRMLLIHSEISGVRIAFPPAPDPAITVSLVETLRRIKATCVGTAIINEEAKSLLAEIYNKWPGIDDVRFESYGNRRFTQLLKLCLIYAAARISTEVTVSDVIAANTLLAVTEFKMPKALGEFGKGKNSDIVHKAMTVIEGAKSPITVADLYKQLSRDLTKIQELQEIVNNLIRSDRVQMTEFGLLPKKKTTCDLDKQLAVDLSLFSQEEIYK